MESNHAISVLKSIPESKAQLTSWIRVAREEILSGEINPIEVDVKLKIMEEMVAGLRKDEAIKAQLIDELAKYPEKTVKIFGVEITKRNMTKYNYLYCGDSELLVLQAEADYANQKLKERQELLKLVKPNQLVNPETGEFLSPPLVTTSESFSIKIL